MGSEVCFSSSSWLGTILSLFFWHWYPWGPSSMSIWSTVSSLSTSIFWNLPSGAQVPSVDKDFPGEVAEYRSLHPSALTSVFVCWAEELCEEVLADESVSKRCPARVFVVFGNRGCRPKEQEQARRSLGQEEVYVFVFNLFDYVCAQSFSRVWLFATPWAVSHQSLPSMEFSRQEYWNG